MGALVTKLISETCSSETRAVIKAYGADGVRVAFEYLGRMAMQELMTNTEVSAAINAFEQYTDKAKIDAVIK